MQESTRLRATPRLVIFSWVLIGLVFGIAMTTAWQAFALGGGYDPRLDVNHDGAIDTQDIQSTAGAWNTTGDPNLVNLVAQGNAHSGRGTRRRV